jgi:hypothetical protein
VPWYVLVFHTEAMYTNHALGGELPPDGDRNDRAKVGHISHSTSVRKESALTYTSQLLCVQDLEALVNASCFTTRMLR